MTLSYGFETAYDVDAYVNIQKTNINEIVGTENISETEISKSNESKTKENAINSVIEGSTIVKNAREQLVIHCLK